jgi:hypothetical protein
MLVQAEVVRMWSVMQTVDSAKQFLLNRLIEQAAADGATLSEIEKRLFLFSELSPNPDWEANEKFEAECDGSEYERKIAKLLRHAYAHDKKAAESVDTWRDSLKALAKEDFYGLVMVDQAKISRPKDYFSLFDPAFAAFAVLELAIVGLAFGVLSSRIHWRFLVSDTLRFAAFAFLVAAAWGLGNVYARFQDKKATERFSRSAAIDNKEEGWK